MHSLRMIAEKKISRAIKDGTLKMDGWKDRPLPPEDDHMVPKDLKMAYKVLKNAGFVPPEIQLRKDINKLEDLIAKTEDEHTRVKQIKKLDFLLLKLNMMQKRPIQLEEHKNYHIKIVEKIGLGNVVWVEEKQRFEPIKKD